MVWTDLIGIIFRIVMVVVLINLIYSLFAIRGRLNSLYREKHGKAYATVLNKRSPSDMFADIKKEGFEKDQVISRLKQQLKIGGYALVSLISLLVLVIIISFITGDGTYIGLLLGLGA